MKYRLYLMDEWGHHIDDVMVIHARSEEEAIEAASETAPTRIRELWDLQRKLGRFSTARASGSQ